jgi:peptidylprolyl isomerase
MIRRFFRLITLFSCVAGALASQNLPEGLYAKLDTSKGEIVLKLEFEKAPLTVCNFVGLAEGSLDAAKGKKFYDGLTFHRVVANFMIQGGDPAGTGRGGPGYKFADEFDPSLKLDRPGTLAMANSGPNTNGSQFFITHVSTPWLDGKHSVFGYVQTGQEVVNAIQQGDKIESITILRVGGKAKAFKCDQKAFNAYAKEIAAGKAQAVAGRLAQQADAIAKRWPGLQKTEDGRAFKVLKESQGPRPGMGQTVSILYKGMLTDGTVFDSSEFHGNKPIQFKVGAKEVIDGFDLTVRDMRKGEKRVVAIPPQLAYGEQGAGDVIPPDSYLVFELELTDVAK